MAELYMMVGVPCSGKSTWVKSNCRRMEILSTDDMITETATMCNKTYTEAFPDLITPAQKILTNTIPMLSYANKSFVIDQTNLSKSTRRAKLGHLKNRKDYKVTAVFADPYIDTILERLEERNKSGGKFIPVGLVEDMYKSLQVPILEEGFDAILYI